MSGSWQDIKDLAAYCAIQGIECHDLTLETAVIALQGPLALSALAGMANVERIERIGYFEHAQLEVAGVPCLLGRLGYTGERGFELQCPASRFHTLWDALASVARPAGFAAADCLRIEAGFPLFTNEFQLAVTATEAGLARFSVTHGDNERVRLVCFRADCEKNPRLWRPPTGTQLPHKRGTISITSATRSTIAGGILGLGYVLAEDAYTDNRIVDPRGEFFSLSVVPLPFYDSDKRRPRDPWS